MRKFFIAFIIVIVFLFSAVSVFTNKTFWPFHPLNMFTKSVQNKNVFEFRVVKSDSSFEKLGPRHTQKFGHIGTVLLINRLKGLMKSDPLRACTMLQYFLRALPDDSREIQVFSSAGDEQSLTLRCSANREKIELK